MHDPIGTISRRVQLGKEGVRHLVTVALREAFTLWPFLDEGAVSWLLTRMCENSDDVDPGSQALLYALIALGLRYETPPTLSVAQELGWKAKE